MTLDKLIDRAVHDQDLDALKRLQQAVAAAATVEQRNGEMAERRVVADPRALLEALGLEAPRQVAESFGLDVANRVADAIRQVELRLDKARRPDFETVVAEGDSWFLHQLLTDTLDHLRSDFNVRSLAAAGDTVEGMVRDKDALLDAVAEENARICLFSGGGNDLLGDGRIAQVVHPDTRGRSAESLINGPAFEHVLGRLMAGYRDLLGALLRQAPGVQVLAHGYDHVVKIASGPWIWPYLEPMGYSEARARDVLRVLLDRFNDALADLERAHANFFYVDMRGAVGPNPNAWHDAIHPRDPGFGRVARRFADQVRSYLARRPAAATRAVVSTAFRPETVPAGETEGTTPLTNESVARAFAYDPRLTDFEALRRAARDVQGNFPDERTWLPYDALTRRHIRDVLELLGESDTGEGTDGTLLDNRLTTQPASALPRGLGEARLAVPLTTGTETPTGARASDAEYSPDPMLSLEAVNEALVGASEIEPVQVLLQGYRVARCVGRIQVMSPQRVHVMHGSGFLVGPGLLLTNRHVLPDPDTAARSYAIFDDEVPFDGSLPHPSRFRLTSELYYASADLDYAFASVEPVNRDGKALADYGCLPLIELSGKALRYEPVSIVQHPGGDPKAIAMRNSFVMGRVDDGIYYTTDTKAGSSGSPVLNREWQVVALHHRFVPHPTDREGVLANRGVRISMIYEDLRKAQAQGGSAPARVLELMRLAGAASVEAEPEPATGTWAPVPVSATRAAAGDESAGGWVRSGVYAGLGEEEFLAAIAREDKDGDSDIPLPDALSEAAPMEAAEALSLDPDRVLARIGARGYRLIVAHEVSSRANYEARLRNPILPAGESGVTIGIGYDLGYQSLAGFHAQWDDLLPPGSVRRLEVCIGKTGSAARGVLAQVRDVVIPYDAAIKVFERDSLPRYLGYLNRHIRDEVLDALHPDCVGALVSLTFNRGPSYQKPGDRYREMRAIRTALNGGKPAQVPGLIRDMKRLWQGRPSLRGLLRRRDEEADLFQAGLDTGAPRGGPELAVAAAGAPDSGWVRVDSADRDFDPTPDLDEGSELSPDPVEARELAVPLLGPADTAWVRAYSNNPDYWHLPASAEGKGFGLTADLIETLIRLGFYEPHFTAAGDLIVGIRGAMIANGEDAVVRAGEIELREQKPDHRGFRCIMAIYHQGERSVSAFRASTVPNRGSVSACANYLSGRSRARLLANLLPTGCYRLCVGVHHGQSHTVPTVLRLGAGPEPAQALTVTTLRTKNDAIYGTLDLWDKCRPADNIHPAFGARTADFSSQGCLTVPGSYSGGVHRGLWAQFRRTAGFDGDRHLGTRYDLVLTTGMELAAIDAAKGDPTAQDRLKRLAHGSRGAPVRALQARLGIEQSGILDPDTKKALVQSESLLLDGAATGIYSVPLDEKSGFGIFQ